MACLVPNIILMFGLGSSLVLVWVSLGLGMVGSPRGCPFSIVALYLLWCRYLGTQEGVQPQLYADNL